MAEQQHDIYEPAGHEVRRGEMFPVFLHSEAPTTLPACALPSIIAPLILPCFRLFKRCLGRECAGSAIVAQPLKHRKFINSAAVATSRCVQFTPELIPSSFL